MTEIENYKIAYKNLKEAREEAYEAARELISDFFGESLHTVSGMRISLEEDHLIVYGCTYKYSNHKEEVSYSKYDRYVDEKMQELADLHFAGLEKIQDASMKYKIFLW